MSSPDSRGLHHPVKLIDLHPPRNTAAPIRLQYHVLQHLLVDLLLEHGRDPLQHRQRDWSVLVVREQPEGLLHCLAVRIGIVGRAGVELEGADGEEGFVGSVAVVLGIENADELLQFGLRRRGDAEGSASLLAMPPSA